MISRYRKYRAAFGIAAVAQTALLSSVYYINCGVTIATWVLGCSRGLPPVVNSLIIELMYVVGWVSVPGFILKEVLDALLFRLRLGAEQFVWIWLLEWGPMLYASAINVVISTIVLGSIFVEIDRGLGIYKSLTRGRRPSLG